MFFCCMVDSMKFVSLVMLFSFSIVSHSKEMNCNLRLRESLSVQEYLKKSPRELQQQVNEIHSVLFDNIKQTQGSRISGLRIVPTSSNLYPYGWGWDTALAAMGIAKKNVELAVKTMNYYIKGSQWIGVENYHEGMIPHIFFNGGWRKKDYFPGPETYGTLNNKLESSTMDQPAVWGLALEDIYRKAVKENKLGIVKKDLEELITRVDNYHQYILDKLDPLGISLPVIHHPWQSGRDNAKAWIGPLSRLKIESPSIEEIKKLRRDIKAPEDIHHRPSNEFYQQVIYLIQRAKENNFRPAFEEFSVVDPLYTSILVWAEESMAFVAQKIGKNQTAMRARKRAQRIRQAMKDILWSEELGRFQYLDVAKVLQEKELIEKIVVKKGLYDPNDIGSYAPIMLKDVPGNEEKLFKELKKNYIDPFEEEFIGLTSLSPLDKLYEPQRYWMGPIWSNVNYFMLVGQGRYERGVKEYLKPYLKKAFYPLYNNGPAEHYNASLSGKAEGAVNFSWDAALAPYFLEALKK